jgi:hypothetical protein
MFAFSLILAGLVLYLIGRVLFRRLGVPHDVESAGRWGLVLLGVAVLFSSCPEIGRRFSVRLPTLPAIEFWDLTGPLLILGLAVIGYLSWSRGAAQREQRAQYEQRARSLPRRRAMPPAPALPNDDQAVFQPLDAHDVENEPPDDGG